VTAGPDEVRQARRIDILELPLLGSVVRWRHLRTLLQSGLAVAAGVVVYDGLTGTQIAPENLAGVVPWVQWRGFTVLSLLLAGSLFCTACPFMLTRRLARRVFPGKRSWPRRLQGKWLPAVLLVLFFWFYEALDPWAQPWLTAALALAYFAGAFVVDSFFRGAAFCKHVCPIGHFNFVHSTCSPLEVATRRPTVCAECTTKDCITGRWVSGREVTAGQVKADDVGELGKRGGRRASLLRDGSRAPAGRWQNGCELGLFQQRKSGNLDCTFCLECIHACPRDNVTVVARVPGRELWNDLLRSGIGRPSQRRDLAALVLVLVFAAFMNAFGMVGPFYKVEAWVAVVLGIDAQWLVLLVVFGFCLVVVPIAAAGGAALATRLLAGSREPPVTLGTRFAYSLVPVGLGMWAAHYGFHFMTGGLAVVPVTQKLLSDLGVGVLGEPRWDLGPLVPAGWLLPIELALLEAGLLGSLVLAFRIAVVHFGNMGRARVAFLPWMVLALLLFAAGVWLLLQPMEMRGTVRSG
jgi:ferredoxin